MKAPNQVGTEVDLRFTTIVDQLRIVEAHMATVPKKMQISSTDDRSQKAEKIKASCFSQKVVETKTLSEEVQDNVGAEYESDSSS